MDLGLAVRAGRGRGPAPEQTAVSELDQFFLASAPPSFRAALLSLVLTFVLSHAIAAVYMWTFRGMSYSRSFVVTVAIGSIVACMLMLAINNSVAAGLGIAGSLAIIRFRTAMRDPRDMVFIFAALGAGIAAGLRAYGAAVAGTLVFLAAAVMLTWMGFGGRERKDGLLRITVPASDAAEGALARVLREHTRHFALVTMREAAQGERMQHAYQVRLPIGATRTAFLRELERIEGADDVSLLLQDPTVEI